MTRMEDRKSQYDLVLGEFGKYVRSFDECFCQDEHFVLPVPEKKKKRK